ncbi:hypothetical protein ACF0H5_012197 [Mactra antiquata]
MASFEQEALSMTVRYNKGGKKNGYLNDDFDRPPDWEHDYSDEDEVFMESPSIDKASATKPLMYPRARNKSKIGRGPLRRCRPIVNAICCFLFLVLSLGSLMGLVVYFVNKHNKNVLELVQNGHIKPHVSKFVSTPRKQDYSDIVGCDHIEVEDVWTVGLPKLLTESAFRLVDVNQDGILDIIFGFATGADGYNIPSIVCDVYFNGVNPCFGGLIALEGGTGKELWRHYSDHELYGVNCAVDLNKDGVLDCLGGGRAGAFQAVSGKDGSLLWNFGKQEAKNDIMNLYTAQYIHDIDGDSIIDILTIHGGDPLQDPGSKYRLSGRVMLMSGRTGEVISWYGVPDERESYYSPQIHQWSDGTKFVLFGTGGETHGGSLWVIKLDDLIQGHMDKAMALFTDKYKGVMTPPALIDITGDHVEDIILPVFNSSLLAIDGQTFKVIWNHTQPMSESYNTPAPGYYNNDNTPDFLIKYAHGPGFPVYYHSTTTVIDGKTGKPLIEPAIRDTVGAQASPITISVEGRGNDIFIYWAADCIQHQGQGGEFKFVDGTNVHEQSRSDFCRLRFKTKGYSKLYAISQHIPAPGTTLYYSEDRQEVEHSKWINTTQEGIEYMMSHPELLDDYDRLPQFDLKDLDVIVPEEAGSESLFENPAFDDDNERTTYKKGPSGYYNQRPSGPKVKVRPDKYPDYDYSDPYNDQFRDYSDRALPRQKGRINYPSEFNNYGKYYKTTPPNKYSRNRYRTRYPPSDRRGKAQERSANDLKKFDNSNKHIKPIAMRDTKNTRKNKTNYPKDNKPFKHDRKRKRRHVGPHDEEGLQRLLSTGSLVPTLLPKNHPMYNNTIDVVFATYWFFPAKTRAILPEDQHCIEKKMSEETIRFNTNSKYYGMDHDAYEHTITDECLEHSDHNLPEEGTYESQTQYDPFNVHMGQMTVYRLRLTCTCSNQTAIEMAGKRCSHVLPFDQQQWYAYMGNNADSHWKPRT